MHMKMRMTERQICLKAKGCEGGPFCLGFKLVPNWSIRNHYLSFHEFLRLPDNVKIALIGWDVASMAKQCTDKLAALF